MVRRIVEINEELCNGCGACASACHEGAIAMIDGKARLIKDDYCDGSVSYTHLDVYKRQDAYHPGHGSDQSVRQCRSKGSSKSSL